MNVPTWPFMSEPYSNIGPIPDTMPEYTGHTKYRKPQKKVVSHKYIMKTHRLGDTSNVITQQITARSVKQAKKKAISWCLDNNCNIEFSLRKAT